MNIVQTFPSFQIAIDGPAASGKGTLARKLAHALNFAHLDTGKIYRAVAYRLLQDGHAEDENLAIHALTVAKNIKPDDIKNPALSNENVAALTSKIAAIETVRAQLITFQRVFASYPPNGALGAVLDGRDIGTVILPNAPIKFFITANVKIRAQRRYEELIEAGQKAIYAEILAQMEERDKRDQNRDIAPSKPADDAIIIDNSTIGEEKMFDHCYKMVMTKMKMS